ncbi:MAG: glycosyltransferase family 1 protein [Candidatus Uhrbacteria bacterium]
MKIGIDARMYGPKVGGGGLGRYVEQLVTKLQEIDQENRYILFLKKENFAACQITNPNFEKRLADIHWYSIDEQRLLPKIIDQEKLDLVHFPHWNVPLLLRTPFVVTIHDLILLDDPSSAKATTLGPIKYALKRFGYRTVLWKAIKRSQKIITVSQATELSILKHFPWVKMRKIEIIYEGVTALTPNPSPRGGGGEYFLYIGNSYPHKNLKILIDAFKIFQANHPTVKLILAGHKDLFSEALELYTTKLDLPISALEFIHDPDDETVAELYAGATLYVFPSKLEGFGLPGLEAMNAGVPVIAARAGSLPEVLGEAAVYFDPNSVTELADQIEKVWHNETLKKELVKKGFEQIKKYSWTKMAEKILEIYRGRRGLRGCREL